MESSYLWRRLYRFWVAEGLLDAGHIAQTTFCRSIREYKLPAAPDNDQEQHLAFSQKVRQPALAGRHPLRAVLPAPVSTSVITGDGNDLLISSESTHGHHFAFIGGAGDARHEPDTTFSDAITWVRYQIWQFWVLQCPRYATTLKNSRPVNDAQ